MNRQLEMYYQNIELMAEDICCTHCPYRGSAKDCSSCQLISKLKSFLVDPEEVARLKAEERENMN